ncbi:hypothetical protein CEXT_411031 [Caerostris extrusa]|uniref:Uncharacterized protein n=1 Tax=Caerostris extrusa TaxID=172846 RepID=A0AAV4SQN6_CAEEX|nr:hypothetical protein CEXT_411031 [Caerostris extrusa]
MTISCRVILHDVVEVVPGSVQVLKSGLSKDLEMRFLFQCLESILNSRDLTRGLVFVPRRLMVASHLMQRWKNMQKKNDSALFMRAKCCTRDKRRKEQQI